MRDTGEDVGHVECLVAVVPGDERVRAGAGGVDTAVVSLSPLYWTDQGSHGLLGNHCDLLLIRRELQMLAYSHFISENLLWEMHELQ